MKRRQAFTLVELLVVIGIIAVLIGILLPALNNARYSASIIKCESNLHQIAIAALGYAANNKGVLPPMMADSGANNWAFYNNSGTWWPGYNLNNKYLTGGIDADGGGAGRLVQQGYLGSRLPQVVVAPYTTAAPTCDWTQAKVLICPSSPEGQYWYYQFNWHMCWRDGGDGNAYSQVWFKKVYNYGKPPTGAVPSLITGTLSVPVSTTTFTPQVYPMHQMCLANDNVDGTLAYSTAGTMGTTGMFPHDFRVKRTFNLAYIDGHVDSVHVPRQFTRAGGALARDIDMINVLELVNEKSNLVNISSPTMGQNEYVPYIH